MADGKGPSMGSGSKPASPLAPPPQHNFQQAAARALAAMRAQSPEQLEWLGARRASGGWTVRVLDDTLRVVLEQGLVRSSSGQPAGVWWQVLTLRYLGLTLRPKEAAPALTFADLPGGRAYAPVYQRRVIGRLCAGVGREETVLRRTVRTLSGRLLEHPDGLGPRAGDLAADFQLYPRVLVRLTWSAGDEDFGPAAALLLPVNIESFFALEDIVVLSERLVSRLEGKGF